MSIESLFRRKTGKGKWIYGHYCPCVISGFPALPCIIGKERLDNGWWEPIQVIPETVGQFTGLTDKNGKKIFEGDIVRGKDYIGMRREGVVEYDVYDATYKIVPKTKSKYRESDTTELLYPADILEVIGNIFDNPELFQKK